MKKKEAQKVLKDMKDNELESLVRKVARLEAIICKMLSEYNER